MATFNLLTESWVPCFTKDGHHELLSLRDTLVRAPELREVLDESPLVTVALHRLMLAILHRVFGPRDAAAWAHMWRAGHWDAAALDEYVDKWLHRFDLFDQEHPFYQTPGLDRHMKWGSVAKLSLAVASGNNPTLFSHAVDEPPPTVTPGEAARWLIATHLFHPGGLVAREKDASSRSAGSAPLANTAVIMPMGTTLFETLMLSLVPYSPEHGQPYEGQSPDDAPAWERDDPTCVEKAYPRGYLDYLTWQSRRVLLKPELGPQGSPIVRYAILADGRRFPEEFSIFRKEQMTAHQRHDKPKKEEDPRPAVALSRDRAFWRDSTALFQAAATDSQQGNDKYQRPGVMDELAAHIHSDLLSPAAVLRVAVAGLCSDRARIAKIYFWRHERLPLPLRYLEDPDLVSLLSKALQCAEDVAEQLAAALWNVAQQLVGESEKARIEARVQALPALRIYWAGLEGEFQRLLLGLAQSRDDPGPVLARWAKSIRSWANEGLNQTLNALPPTAQVLPLSVEARRRLGGQLKRLLSPYEPEEVNHAHA